MKLDDLFQVTWEIFNEDENFTLVPNRLNTVYIFLKCNTVCFTWYFRVSDFPLPKLFRSSSKCLHSCSKSSAFTIVSKYLSFSLSDALRGTDNNTFGTVGITYIM